MDKRKLGVSWLAEQFDKDEFRNLHEEMTFNEYIEKCEENPRLARSSYQRLYDMIVSFQTNTFKKYRKTYTHYSFFDSEVPIFGLDEETLNTLVKVFRGAAGWYGTERRIILLHGPVGSSKSTICRRIKRGLEVYSRLPEGAWYSYKWINLPTGKEGIYTHTEDDCPMHDDPLKLIPIPIRNKFLGKLNDILREQTPEKDQESLYSLRVDGDLNPRCNKFMEELLLRNDGDWAKVVNNHIRVVRKVHTESGRVGIATFQPKDEKNQDATELTGDIDYSKLPHFGADSDPRAFNFDGEFCVGNRGVTEFIEMLKLDKAFLYDLLGVSQERCIKPKKFPQISVDTVILAHTNDPEFQALRNDKTMEALRDRTITIDVPYLRSWNQELKVLEQDYGPGQVRQHVAPHTLEVAALWSVITRLQDDHDNKLSLVDKAKLYDGRYIHGYTEDTVKEMRDKYPDEGMASGVSVRYVQDKISNCLSSHYDYINPFMVMNELKEGLSHSALIVNKDEQKKYITCIDLAMKELDQILKTEVQRALVGDEDTIKRLCTQYIDNVFAYIHKSKVINPYTQKEQEPDERLMRNIEEKIDIPETGVDDFRRQIAAFIGGLHNKKEEFTWDSNPRLKKALEAKLFEDTKDHIKLSALNQAGASVVDPDLQEKIDAIKQRLINQHHYNHKSAEDILSYVGSIFARGDSVDDE